MNKINNRQDLGIMPSQNVDDKVAEFEKYAGSYSKMLEDPMRARFTRNPMHFYWRKWIVIQNLFRIRGLNPKGLSWLDVGCGGGELLSLIGEKFAHAAGCDPSPSMLPQNAHFETRVQPSLAELPFQDHSVDFVTAVCVLHHVHGTNRQALMREVRRVLRTGGYFCIIEHNPWNPVTQLIVKRCPVDVDADLHTARRAARLAQSADFQSVTLDYFLYLPESLFNRFGAIETLLCRVPLGGQYALLLQAQA